MTLIVYLYIKQSNFSKDDSKSFFTLLNESGPNFVPQSFNYYEPIKEPYDPHLLDKPIDMLTTWGSILLKRVAPGYLMSLNSGHPQHNRWMFQFQEPFYKDSAHCQALIKFIQNLCKLFSPLYAIATLEKDHNAKHCIYDSETGRSQGLRGAILSPGEGLPGIYWLNVFGSTLVEFFGREKLLHLQEVEVFEAGSNCIAIQVYTSPMEADAQWRREKEQKIVEALGSEYFFDIVYYAKTKRPRRRTLIPGITKK
jgi:hypothetical protein